MLGPRTIAAAVLLLAVAASVTLALLWWWLNRGQARVSLGTPDDPSEVEPGEPPHGPPGTMPMTAQAANAPRTRLGRFASGGLLLVALVIIVATAAWVLHPTLPGHLRYLPNRFCATPIDAVETLWVGNSTNLDERCLVEVGSRTLAAGGLLLALVALALLLVLWWRLDRSRVRVPLIALSSVVVAMLVIGGSVWAVVGRRGPPPSKEMVQLGFEQSGRNAPLDPADDWIWYVRGASGQYWVCSAHADAIARQDFVQTGMYSCR